MEESREYEFTDSQNRVIGELAGRLRFIGVFSFALGVLHVACGVVAASVFIVAAACEERSDTPGWAGLFFLIPFGLAASIFLATGHWMNKGAAEFKLIVATRGHDVQRLLRALAELEKLYSLWSILLRVGLALVVVQLAVALLT